MSFVLLFQALDGFIAVITQDGQLFYVSENVRDFLGYSQVSFIFYKLFCFIGHVNLTILTGWPLINRVRVKFHVCSILSDVLQPQKMSVM